MAVELDLALELQAPALDLPDADWRWGRPEVTWRHGRPEVTWRWGKPEAGAWRWGVPTSA